MKIWKIIFLLAAIVACCASCDKDDDDDPNLKVIVVGSQGAANTTVTVYSLLDVTTPIISGKVNVSGRFECRLNPGDYKVDASSVSPCNCQIQSRKTTVVKYINSQEATVTYE